MSRVRFFFSLLGYKHLTGSFSTVWRTSTAEPTRTGIIWSYEKDVTRFSPLFAKPSELLLELNNVIDDTYTGVFSTVLSATFYEPTDDFPAPPSVDLILPVTTGSKNGSQMLVYPGDASSNVTIPPNTSEAWLEVIATGAAAEEVRPLSFVFLLIFVADLSLLEQFWYKNVLDRWKDFWPKAGLDGKGPFREVQVLVDGVIGESLPSHLRCPELTLLVKPVSPIPFPYSIRVGRIPFFGALSLHFELLTFPPSSSMSRRSFRRTPHHLLSSASAH